MKKRLAAVLCLSMMMGVLAGCSGGNSAGTPAKETAQAAAGTGNGEQAESKPEKTAADSAGGSYADFPTKNITYICSGSAGGGLDLCARMISPYIEKYLPGKGTVTVENVTGGQNWNAWIRLIQSAPDGYNIGSLATPQFCNYLNKSLQIQYTMDDYTPLVNCVTDYCTICVRADDSRFDDVDNLEELVACLKENSGTEFLVSLTSGGGADEIAMYEFMEWSKITNMTGINYADGISASKAGFLGAETDIYFGKVGDSFTMFEDGNAKILAVLASERSEILPDVPTGKEQGFDVVLGSSRGIVVPNGMDEELKAILEDACKKASEDPDYLATMKAGGYEVDFMGSEEYAAYLAGVKEMVEKYADQLGYNE
ncbi:tripartite tricarboxylate transporter substrate binding protein [uncultured Clostridium sp.]|uniref:tripartite tricarboxylate transporter substrate binding protein n=1 Tax=uncultured Clostridium sp. TaxID=59620 RepID=UPI0025E1E1B2|nr:tripartite tricarboxylate transporter substrate binding protein [uncultured Clostridium sp.]